MNLQEYTYELPDDKIAKYPLAERDVSKLLVYNQGHISHRVFYEIPDLLPNNSFLVFNNTKVIPARLFFQKPSGAVIELFLLHPVQPTSVISQVMELTDSCVWECMIGNKKRWKNGNFFAELLIDNQTITLEAELIKLEENLVKLSWKNSKNIAIRFVDIVQYFGRIPLPPYLNREATEEDSQTYQTVYSQNKGAVAAPTAGLHFTKNVLAALTEKGIKQEFLTLHVGAGTFQPIKVDNILEHKMHNEQLIFTKQNIENLLENLDNIIPVGTTSMRALESLYWFGVKLLKGDGDVFFIDKLYPYQYDSLPTPMISLSAVLTMMKDRNWTEIIGETEVFIFPSYRFQLCKGIITNFHQPNSTLLLLIAALVGEDWKKIYQEALKTNYRFLSYGDSSFLFPKIPVLQ